MKTYFYSLICILLLSPIATKAQTSYANTLNQYLQQKYQLSGGTWLYGQDEQTNLMTLTHQSNAYCNGNTVFDNSPDPVFNEDFTKERTLNQTCTEGSKPWDSLFKLPNFTASEGDLYLIVYWAKNANTTGSRKAAIHWNQKYFVNNGNTERSNKLRFTNLTNDWERYIVPIYGRAGTNIIRGRLGFKDQDLMIGGFAVIKFPGAANSVDFSEFHEGSTYSGIDGSTSWINTANQGINDNRMKDFVFDVRDDNGNPVSNATITIEQVESEFQWGTSDKGYLLDNVNYRNLFGDLFNSFSFESDLLWDNWEIPKSFNLDYNTGNHSELKQAMDWVVSKNYKTRLHNVLWPSREHIPPSVTGNYIATDFSESAFISRLDQHMNNILGNAEVKRNLSEIDVVNEPTLNRWVECDDVSDDCSNNTIGFNGAMDIYAFAFDKAKALAPNATLFINEYVGMDMGDYQVYGSERMKHIIDNINARSNVGVEAIGLQGHMKYAVPPQTVLNILDSFAPYADEIKITEFDMDGLKDNIKPNYLRDFMTAMFSHEKVTGFQMWGFRDFPNQAERILFNEDGTPKEYFEEDGTPKESTLDVYLQLTQNEWWTDTLVYTNANGLNTTRAFKGKHKVKITKNGSVLYDETLTLSDSDVSINIGGSSSGTNCEQLQNPNFDFNNDFFEVKVYDDADAFHGHNSYSPEYDHVLISDGRDSKWKVQLRQSAVTLEQGATYTLKLRARADANKPFYFNMRKVSNNQTYAEKHVTANTSWQEFEHTFTMNYSTDTNAQLTIGLGGNNINIRFDYISLEKHNCAPVNCNLILNGDYSSGLDNWDPWVNPNSQAIAQFYNSNGAALINIDEIGNNTWDIQHIQNNLVFDAGKQYLIKFDARATGNRPVNIAISRTVPSYAGYLYSSQQLTTQWQSYEIPFNPNQNISNGRLVFNLGASARDVFIDDVEIIDLSACPNGGRLAQNVAMNATAYPNPFSDQLRVDLSKLSSDSGVVLLYDLQGRLILEKAFQEENELYLDTDLINSGIYLLKVRTGFSETSIKVVKH